MTGHSEDSVKLTAEEAAVYDRQIRLWGVEAQQRLRKARVLLAGMSSLGNEVCKNILLAGIKHLTILDDKDMTKTDFDAQFFSSEEDIGKNRAEASVTRSNDLNPMVDVVADKENIQEKSVEFFKNFDVVCLNDYPADVQIKVNEICHRLGIKFLSGNVFGYYGYMFQDLGQHKYMEEVVTKKILKKKDGEEKDEEGPSTNKKQKVEQTETEYEEKVSKFCSLNEALAAPLFRGKSLRQAKQVSKTYLVMKVLFEYQKKFGEFPQSLESNQKLQQLSDIRSEVFEKLGIDDELLNDDFASHCVGKLFPVCPIVGGVIAQEVIKAVSGKDAPHNNFFFYDGVATSGVVVNISDSTCQVGDKKQAPVTTTIFDEIVL